VYIDSNETRTVTNLYEKMIGVAKFLVTETVVGKIYL